MAGKRSNINKKRLESFFLSRQAFPTTFHPASRLPYRSVWNDGSRHRFNLQFFFKSSDWL